ncbi:hypothetical protein BPO_0021 [Bergeyella porcorum]|uniref:Uncharacterized protein n=1 Tax=Bergeyella porcorum TaxID=1735111 RepID=A0AAU0EZS9_9FLAO
MDKVQKAIANYSKAGIEIKKEDNIIIISQKKLINGYILNQKQLRKGGVPRA